jgi:hypothetical protein
MEPPGGDSGNIECTWGMYNNPTDCSTPTFRAPHNNNNNNNNIYAEPFQYSVNLMVYYLDT